MVKLIKLKKILLLKTTLLFIVFFIPTYPQISDISFDHIFLEEGLSQSIVKCMLQDHRGFMYFGTEDGLNIYDAYTFNVFRNSFDPNSLSYNDITALCEDEYGRIWIGTFNSGVNLYIPEKKRFVRFYFNRNNTNSLSNDNINAIVEDKEGNIWIGTDNGLNQIVKPSPTSSTFIIKRGVTDNNKNNLLTNVKVLSLLIDSQGILWVGTNEGLIEVFNESGKPNYTLLKFKNDFNNQNSLSNNIIRAIYEDKSGDLWIGTDYGLNKITSADRNKTFSNFKRYIHSASNNKSISHNEIYAISEDAAGLIWIGTNGGGINIYDRKKNQFVHYLQDPVDDRSLSANEIRSLFMDRSGIMWIGTYGSGINKVSRGTGQFYHYRHQPNDQNSLSHPIVWSFYQDDDSVLWVGTHNGLDKINRKTNSFKHYNHIPGKNSLSNNVVRVITPMDDGRLLLGTNGGGVDEFNPRTGLFKNWSHDPNNSNSLNHNEIRSIYVDNNGIFWIGTYGRGMDRFDPSTGVFKHYVNNPTDTNSLSQNYARVIYEDKEGYLWIGTEGGGINKFDKNKEKFIRYRAKPGNSKALNSDYIFSILEDSSGYLWLGTYGGGLNKFNSKTGEVKSYSINDGLPSGSIYGVVQDRSGNFWISTNNGLSKFNLKLGIFKNYNVKDGLQNNEFNGGSYYKTKSGELLFGGINGFNAFYSENIKDNNYIPPIVLTSFEKFNEEVKISQPLTSLKEIDLSYSDNVFSFEFAALDYSAPEKNKYAYKMEGVDKDWVYVNANKRFAAYTTLSPGKYIFYVKGSNSDGVWNDDGIKLIINIIPPFWQRFWFILLAAFLIIGIAYILYLRRLRIIRMKIELQTAHDAQLSIMPHSDPVNDQLEISGTCIPANEVGGDFFDYFWLERDQNKLGIMIGDVSGKAMKAAITAIMTSGMIISETRSNRSISRILENVNASLLSKIEKNMFVSACISVIDMQNKQLSIANAGLNRPIILSDGKVEFLLSDGPRLPLGVKSDIKYEETNYKINRGDIIILTTDGVNEAQNSNRELYGDERLKNLLLNMDAKTFSAVEIKDLIIKEVQKFTKSEKPNDDMTVLVIRIK
jgi:ligand-binding sensor domain-containing protein